MKTIDIAAGLDGSHRGLTDLYPEGETALRNALANKSDFQTLWWGSKHEIASARVSRKSETVTVEVSVSDDFDTPGRGERTGTWDTFDQVLDAINLAWDDANQDQKNNRCYDGFSVLKGNSWVETLILPRGDGVFLDSPPGDYYEWYWQGDFQVPETVKDFFMAVAHEGQTVEKDGFVLDPWEKRPTPTESLMQPIHHFLDTITGA